MMPMARSRSEPAPDGSVVGMWGESGLSLAIGTQGSLTWNRIREALTRTITPPKRNSRPLFSPVTVAPRVATRGCRALLNCILRPARISGCEACVPGNKALRPGFSRPERPVKVQPRVAATSSPRRLQDRVSIGTADNCVHEPTHAAPSTACTSRGSQRAIAP